MKAEEFDKKLFDDPKERDVSWVRINDTSIKEIILTHTEFAEAYAKHLIESISDEEIDFELCSRHFIDTEEFEKGYIKCDGAIWFKQKLLKTLEK